MGIDWTDTQVFWLNVLNAAVGVAALLGMAVMGGAFVLELFRRFRGGAGRPAGPTG